MLNNKQQTNKSNRSVEAIQGRQAKTIGKVRCNYDLSKLGHEELRIHGTNISQTALLHQGELSPK